MTEDPGSPIFAGRYRFQQVSSDWDRGRSGYTVLVLDIKKNKFGVIKRAELISPYAVQGLKNEVTTLLKLRGKGTPNVYDTGKTEYGSKKYFYMVIEYIDGMRVEKHLDALTASERAEILTQLFWLLARAHKMGIVNGDVDLKHLFWLKDQKKLVVIDWGNSKLNVHLKDKAEFAYDLARSAEIVYSLITKGHPASTGTISLPDDTVLNPSLTPLPVEFRALCEWAPRAPVAGMVAPYTAEELYEVSKRWSDAVRNQKPYTPPKAARRRTWLIWVPILLLLLGFLAYRFAPNLGIFATTATNTPSPTSTTQAPISSLTVTLKPADTVSPTNTALSATPTLEHPTATPAITPSARAYRTAEPILLFDKSTSASIESSACWKNELTPDFGMTRWDGFSRRDSDNNWRFGAAQGRALDERIQTDFSGCLDSEQIGAIALNVWIPQLNAKREFGLFIEDENGQRLEYTVWVEKIDGVDKMYVRVRGKDNIDDYEELIINHLVDLGELRPNYQFPIQILLEINNQGLNILYLGEGPLQEPVQANEIDPAGMKRIDEAVRPSLGKIQKIGLVGYGGEIQTVIWPLAFYRK